MVIVLVHSYLEVFDKKKSSLLDIYKQEVRPRGVACDATFIRRIMLKL